MNPIPDDAAAAGGSAITSKGRRPRWVATAALFVVLVLLSSVAVFEYIELRRVHARLSELEWEAARSAATAGYVVLTPEIGTIQFLPRGYSLFFSSVRYTPEGLSLNGSIGNPTGLSISSLTLTFTAYSPFYLQHENFIKNAGSGPIESIGLNFMWPREVGKGQAATIAMLLPGTQHEFTVTVPNVKQTEDGFVLTVSFSGERYAYGLQ